MFCVACKFDCSNLIFNYKAITLQSLLFREYIMITKVIKIGNSRGIRIPKSFIDQSGIKNEVELEIINKSIVIKSLS